MKRLFFLLLLCSFPLLAAKHELSLSASLLKMNYKEFSNGGVLDSEKSRYGDLQGWKVSYGLKAESILFSVWFRRVTGTTLYRGSNMTGTFAIAGKEKGVWLNELSTYVGYSILNDETNIGRGELYCLVGAGERVWNRGRLRNYKYDYDEKYRWRYYQFGLLTDIQFGNLRIAPAIFYRRAISPKLDADLLGGLRLKLGRTYGYLLQLPLEYDFSKSFFLMMEVEYSYWKINKSDIVQGFYEPTSKTKNSFVQVGIGFRF